MSDAAPFQCTLFTSQDGAYFPYRYGFTWEGRPFEAVGLTLASLRANLHMELEHASGDVDFWFEVSITKCGKGLTVSVNREAVA